MLIDGEVSLETLSIYVRRARHDPHSLPNHHESLNGPYPLSYYAGQGVNSAIVKLTPLLAALGPARRNGSNRDERP
jgi:hypothetical protein